MRISDVAQAVALFAALGPVAALSQPAAAAAGAEIVLLVGKGEKRNTEQAPWSGANVNEKVIAGGYVRTLVNSQMGIYLPDRTQVRLNQNSQLQIKTIADAAQFNQTQLQLTAGRAWSQAKPQTAPGGANTGQPRVTVQTPTATMGVRGTDWEIEVAPNGETQLVVLSGVVEMSNDKGSLSVGAGEAAVAREGQAPVRLTLVNPAGRVQWVSSWRPQPRRWAGGDATRHSQAIARIEAGDHAVAVAQLRPLAAADSTAALLLADVLLHQGDIAGAANALTPHRASGDARVASLLARVLARQDQTAQARQVASEGLARSPRNVELLLAQGELAALDGDASGAREAFSQALAVEPRNADAWYGIGLIESQRENVRQARYALGESLKSDAAHSQANAELAATETFAGNLQAARVLLETLLAREPDNYAALTSLGVYKLKSGQTAAALDDFLKAGLIEPRYTRAWLYAGVAFYQLGETSRAQEAFAKASQLDPRDPLPYMYQTMAATDALQYGAAIDSARNAQQRMPFLKSLNQIASDQKGSANLGSSLADFGMEEWAGYYANESMSPYWGGSHLFLADRQTGKFNRNSELFQGFLTDPVAFGAPTRRSSLVSVPGHYARVDLMAERGDWKQVASTVTLNGLSVMPAPIAYFASGDFGQADAVNTGSSARLRNFTLGLGMKPRHDIGVFAFATETRMKGQLRDPSLPDDRLVQDESRADIGLNFKLTPVNQFWLKAGSGQQANHVSGTIFSPDTAAALNTALRTNIIQPNGLLNGFNADIAQRDVQLRHAFDAGGSQWSWGVERSRQERSGGLTTTLAPVRIALAEQYSLRANDVWGSVRHRWEQGHETQLDLFRQHSTIRRSDSDALFVLPNPKALGANTTNAQSDESQWNLRLGARFSLAPLQSLRVVGQRWRRPASVGTLSPVDTLGVAVNDRLPAPGGMYQRTRIQYDGEFGGNRFAHAFADRERVDNGLAGQRSPVSDFELTQLESLRDRPDVFSAKSEIEETPRFVEGRISSIGGAMNWLVSRQQSIAVRYVHRDAKQTGAMAGLRIPFLPRNYLRVGAQWALPDRWLLGASATWRSERYRDDANRDLIDAGWAFGVTAYWESADKRTSLQAIADNLLTKKSAGKSSEPRLLVRYSYNFDWGR
ncbi:tetratricopeptide repeat protein [Caenimonas sp. SL110]|uniref:tetratricopeptide repeat protein n=1 Tax=Caenimonas sp. SL110 TaxID=1450524 RepID=UPI0013791500|nr:tetratricopeptide repeat protein [Caenimonas sp. SL110]